MNLNPNNKEELFTIEDQQDLYFLNTKPQIDLSYGVSYFLLEQGSRNFQDLVSANDSPKLELEGLDEENEFERRKKQDENSQQATLIYLPTQNQLPKSFSANPQQATQYQRLEQRLFEIPENVYIIGNSGRRSTYDTSTPRGYHYQRF